MVFFNPNPHGRNVGDCVIRAISRATGKCWDDIYTILCAKGFELKNWGNGNDVWHSYLKQAGFKRHLLPDECPEGYTIGDFARDNPIGTYLVSASAHVVCVENGNIYDTWPSEKELALDYWTKGE